MSRFSTLGRMALVPAAIVCFVALPGCGSKVTPENYAKITPGMSDSDVTAILGTPTSSVDSQGLMGPATTKVWKDGDKSITVLFVQNKSMAVDKAGF